MSVRKWTVGLSAAAMIAAGGAFATPAAASESTMLTWLVYGEFSNPDDCVYVGDNGLREGRWRDYYCEWSWETLVSTLWIDV